MLLRMVDKPRDSEILKQKIGLLDGRREFLIFINKSELYNMENNYAPITGIAVQINMSLVTPNRYKSIYSLPYHNFNNVHVNLYYYNIFIRGGLDNLANAEFLLKKSFSKTVTNSYDKGPNAHSTFFDPSMYDSNIFSFDYYDAINPAPDEFKQKIDATKDIIRYGSGRIGENEVYSIIPVPMYYNADHQVSDTNEIASIHDMDYILRFSGQELFDDSTKIKIIDIGSWVSADKLANQYVEDYLASGTNAYGLINDCGFAATDNLITGSTCIYDSEAGFRMIGGNIPFMKQYDKELVKRNIETFTNTVKYKARELEKDHGSVRVHYSPLFHGDKMKAYFRDYGPDNQPHLKDIPSKYDGKINIDKESTIDNVVNEILDSMGAERDY